MIGPLLGLLVALSVCLPGRKPGSVCRLDDLISWARGR